SRFLSRWTGQVRRTCGCPAERDTCAARRCGCAFGCLGVVPLDGTSAPPVHRPAPPRSGYFLTGAFFAGRAADLPAVFVVGALDAGAALALFFVGATFAAGLAGAGIGGA